VEFVLKAKSSKIELRDEDSIVGVVGKMDKFEDDSVDSGVRSYTSHAEDKSNPESKENSPRKEEKDKEDLSKSEKKTIQKIPSKRKLTKKVNLKKNLKLFQNRMSLKTKKKNP